MHRAAVKPTGLTAAAEITPEQATAFGFLAIPGTTGGEAFAPMPACENCDHAFAAHEGDEGPCGMSGCECMGYAPQEVDGPDKEPDNDPDDRDKAAVAAPPYYDLTSITAANAAVRIVFTPDSVAAVTQALVNNTIVVAEGDPLPDGAIEVGSVVGRSVDELQAHIMSFDRVAVAQPEVESLEVALPPEHTPGETAPAPAPSAEPTPPVAGPDLEWSAILCPEGQLTSDGRAFEPGSITWRELPLTLMAMTETSEGGHIGAEVAGRIDRIWRDEAAGLIRAAGVFDTGEYGQKIAGLVADQTLRGVSVDLAIHNYEVGPQSDWFDEDGNWAPKPEGERAEVNPIELLLGMEEATVAVVTGAEIGMTTVCPFPAFAVAKIAVGDSLIAGGNPAFWTVTSQAGWLAVRKAPRGRLAASEPTGDVPAEKDCGCGDGALTASAAGLAPVAPPANWFTAPVFEGPTALTVDEDGRVYGHAALWDVCHIGLPGCRTAPHSTTDYSYFHLGEIELDDGTRTECGQITIDAPHADLHMNGQEASAHYDHTGCVVAHVRVGEDEHGIWVAGALEPTASAEKVRLLRGAKLSGDWRKFDGTGHELVALLAVNVPGFPVPRARAIVASAEAGEQVLALVAAGIPFGREDLTPEQRAEFDALALAPEFQRLAA